MIDALKTSVGFVVSYFYRCATFYLEWNSQVYESFVLLFSFLLVSN